MNSVFVAGKSHAPGRSEATDLEASRLASNSIGRSVLTGIWRVTRIFILLAMLVIVAHAEDVRTNQMERLTEMSPEELMNQEVTSVSKKPEKISESAAAISVLTQEDIQRSGAMSIPEALRVVPGLDVAQVDSQQWAVSARGFNDIFADKLLVMQDGRSLYTPLFSGVFWDVQSPLLEDIDRIEVIRGPGASLWGANAVNGVISIITKPASETQGVTAIAGGGSYEQDFAAFRYGDKLADDVYYRVDGHYFDRTDTRALDGNDAHDAWRMGQGSFRIDWDKRKYGGDLLTLEGAIYAGSMDQIYGTFNPATPTVMVPMIDIERVGGGNILGRWSHSLSESNDVTLQLYYDRTERDSVVFRDALDVYDIDIQHHFSLFEKHRNEVVWGLGYRLNVDRLGDTATVSFNPSHQDAEVFSAFAQDEITLIENRLRLTVGARLEHNDYTGFEFQPDGRLLWTPVEHHELWAGVSRALRTPSEADNYIRLNGVIPSGGLGAGLPATPATIYGNDNFVSEELLAYQVGYRAEPCPKFSLDVTAFYNLYSHLRGESPGASPTQPFIPGSFPLHVDNNISGRTYGVEIAPTWQIMEGWRLQPSYSLLKMVVDGPTQDATVVNNLLGESPEQQCSLRSSMDLPQNLTFDLTVRYVDRLAALGVNSYVAADARLAWRPTRNLEIALVGQNLGATHHSEFAPTFISSQRAEIREGAYAKVTWHF